MSASKPITVRLPIDLVEKLEKIQVIKKDKNMSDTVRYLLEQATRYTDTPVEEIVSEILKKQTHIPLDVASKYVNVTEKSLRLSEDIYRNVHKFDHTVSKVKDRILNNIALILTLIGVVAFATSVATVSTILIYFWG